MIDFSTYFAKSALVLKAITTKKGLALVPLAITMPVILSNTQKAIMFLIGMMMMDFVTGIGASYSRRKRDKKAGKDVAVRLISSEKLRRSGVKFLLYSMTILTSFGIQWIFQLKTFTLSITDLQMTLTLGIISFWCIVEFYSIFFENFKDMGIDIKLIVKKLTALASFFREKANEVCGDKKEE